MCHRIATIVCDLNSLPKDLPKWNYLLFCKRVHLLMPSILFHVLPNRCPTHSISCRTIRPSLCRFRQILCTPNCSSSSISWQSPHHYSPISTAFRVLAPWETIVLRLHLWSNLWLVVRPVQLCIFDRTLHSSHQSSGRLFCQTIQEFRHCPIFSKPTSICKCECLYRSQCWSSLRAFR